MLDQERSICDTVSIPVLSEGGTGNGNAINVCRTVSGYAKTGFSAVTIEDQVSPKRCGYTKGKLVVELEEAKERIADGRCKNEGQDILIIERTDARQKGSYFCSCYITLLQLHLKGPFDGGSLHKFDLTITVLKMGNYQIGSDHYT